MKSSEEEVTHCVQRVTWFNRGNAGGAERNIEMSIWRVNRDDVLRRRHRGRERQAWWSDTLQLTTLWDKDLQQAYYIQPPVICTSHSPWKDHDHMTQREDLAMIAKPRLVLLSFTCPAVQRSSYSSLSHKGDRQVYYLCISLCEQLTVFIILGSDQSSG